MEENKPQQSPTVKINLRMSTRDDIRISQLAKSAKVTKAEVIRRLIAAGFENTDYKNVSEKYDVLLDRMQKMSDDMAAHFRKIAHDIDQVDQRINRVHHNVIRANIFLDEFSRRLIPTSADYIEMRSQVKIKLTEFMNMKNRN